jgi:hypothetical protein
LFKQKPGRQQRRTDETRRVVDRRVALAESV